MIGYTKSAMESGVWEEPTNIASISTVKSLQIADQLHAANPSQISVVTIDPGGSAPTSLPSQIQNSINNTYLAQGYEVEVPTQEVSIGNSSSELWTGVGYIIRKHDTTRDPLGTLWWDWGYIIQGGVNGAIGDPHGGFAVGPPGPVNYTLPTVTNTYVSEPINTADGDVVHDQTDFSIPNLGDPLSVVRHYHSANTQQSWSDRGMGDGWTFTYSDTLTSDGQGNMVGTPTAGRGWSSSRRREAAGSRPRRSSAHWRKTAPIGCGPTRPASR